jgi:hypothetical protein
MEFIIFECFVLTLADGLCCAEFEYPILRWCRCPEKGISSIDWAQLIRFYLKRDTECSLEKLLFNKKRTMFR